MHRRHLLHACAALPLAVSSTRLWASRAAGGRLLVVFLRGGYDALTLLVPRRGLYAEVRPSLAVPLAAEGSPGAVPLDADWALHPAVEASLLPLVQAGQLAFVPFAGTDDLSRSHFETQDSIELGQPLQGPRDLRSGFLNRLAEVLGHRGAIAFNERVPLALQGTQPAQNLALRRMPKGGTLPLQAEIDAMYQGTVWEKRLAEAHALRQQAARTMARGPTEGDIESLMASRDAMSANGFEGEAARIGRLMRQGHDLGFVDVGGWDTHVGQGGLAGPLPTRLGELGRGLAAFGTALGPAEWQRTVVVVVSEFGRTVRENGGKGTDHGHGSVYLVLGGGLAAGVRARPVVGEQVPVEARTLHQDRDLPVLNDYRGLLGGVMARLYGLGPQPLERVFPGARPVDLGLL